MITVHYNPLPLREEDIMGARYSVHPARITSEEGLDELGYILLRHTGVESDWVEVYLGDSQPIPGEGFYGDMIQDCIPTTSVPIPPEAGEVDWTEFFEDFRQLE